MSPRRLIRLAAGRGVTYTRTAVVVLPLILLAVWINDSRNQDEIAAAHNPLVCVTRQYISASRARSDFIAKHDKDATRRAAARQAVASADVFLSALITIPRGVNCRHVLKP